MKIIFTQTGVMNGFGKWRICGENDGSLVFEVIWAGSTKPSRRWRSLVNSRIFRLEVPPVPDQLSTQFFAFWIHLVSLPLNILELTDSTSWALM